MGCITSQTSRPKAFSDSDSKYHINILKDKKLPFLFTEEKNDDKSEYTATLPDLEDEKQDESDKVHIYINSLMKHFFT